MSVRRPTVHFTFHTNTHNTVYAHSYCALTLTAYYLIELTMPPKAKKKDADSADDKFMRAARFGRVKNDLKMG